MLRQTFISFIFGGVCRWERTIGKLVLERRACALLRGSRVATRDEIYSTRRSLLGLPCSVLFQRRDALLSRVPGARPAKDKSGKRDALIGIPLWQRSRRKGVSSAFGSLSSTVSSASAVPSSSPVAGCEPISNSDSAWRFAGPGSVPATPLSSAGVGLMTYAVACHVSVPFQGNLTRGRRLCKSSEWTIFTFFASGKKFVKLTPVGFGLDQLRWATDRAGMGLRLGRRIGLVTRSISAQFQMGWIFAILATIPLASVLLIYSPVPCRTTCKTWIGRGGAMRFAVLVRGYPNSLKHRLLKCVLYTHLEILGQED